MEYQELMQLENKSIYILRAAVSRFDNVAALWSMGKDSTVMLALARKAFLGKVPFPVIHIDNGMDFPETYKFRKELTRKWGLNLIVAESEIKQEISGFSCCGENKTNALRKVMEKEHFDALIVSIRRDEHGIRAKERYVSPRDKNFRWNYKEQGEDMWDNYRKGENGGHSRIHPILDWTERDVWNYIKREKIPVNPLYYARSGKRYRSLGCTGCSSPVKSDANSINKIIGELEYTNVEERAGRNQDKERRRIMEKLRALGYM